ncbi:MAG: hypothetical protein AMXMBFR34_06530 [Myxococcaceae bacterium]
MSDDTRALRKALEDVQAAARDGRRRLAELERRLAEAEERERRLGAQWTERGERIQALAAERLRGQSRARAASVAPESDRPPGLAPRPPALPAGSPRFPLRVARTKAPPDTGSPQRADAPPPPDGPNSGSPPRAAKVVFGRPAADQRLTAARREGRLRWRRGGPPDRRRAAAARPTQHARPRAAGQSHLRWSRRAGSGPVVGDSPLPCPSPQGERECSS